MFDYRDPKGTMEDVNRVGAESSDAIQGLLARDAQLGTIAWKIQMSASTLDNLSTRTSPYGSSKETYGIGSVLEVNRRNEALNSDATPWKGITEEDWTTDKGRADSISTAYIYDHLSYASTIFGSPYAEEQLVSISNDCAGKSFARDQWLGIFSDLNDNYVTYTTTKSDDEGGYLSQKYEAARLRNGAYMGGIDKIIAKAGVTSAEPDPQDLAEPWFEAIDQARIKNGVEPMPLEQSGAVVEPIADQPFTGTWICPVPVVTVNGKKLKQGTDFELYYQDNFNMGTATVKIDGIGKYTGELQTTFKIVQPSEKKANPMVAKGLKKTVKLGKAKALKKAVTVTGAVKFTAKPKGAVTYARVAKSSAKCLSIAKNTGKVTVKKGTKAGTYKLKAKVKAAGNATFMAKTQKVTVTIRVKA